MTASKLDVKSPSKLITEIYFPVKPKVIPVEPEITPVYKPQSETQTQKPAATTPATKTQEEQSEF